jgi:electron transfer flavoprotein beta subunit
VDVAVCVKQIPSPDTPGALDPETHHLVRDGGLVLDDSDSYPVEMALRLVEQAGGGEVTLLSMVPNGETAGLRTALAMGAARAVLVSDPALAGSDALSTAKVLAAAVRRTDAALVLAATESTDGYTGTTPVQLAELLGWPAVSFARKVELDGTGLRVERQTERGFDEVTCPLPAVVTVTAGVVEVRYPSFKGIMSARSKPVEELDLADLGIDASQVGALGARQVVVSVERAESRAAGEVITDDGEAHLRILALLEDWKVI